MNKISTHLVKLDLKIILKNYKKPEFWMKDWLIYKHNGIEIIWHITHINVRQNSIASEVLLNNYSIVRRRKKYSGLGYQFELQNIPIKHEEYSQKLFEKNLIGACKRAIHWIETDVIRDFEEYRTAVELDNKENSALTEIAEEFLDENGVENSEIRDAYIDHYVSNNTSNNHSDTVSYNYEYKVLTNEYLIMLSYFNDEEQFKDMKELGTKRAKSMALSLWRKGREIDSTEWTETMKENLESI